MDELSSLLCKFLTKRIALLTTQTEAVMHVLIDGNRLDCMRVQFPKFSKEPCASTIAIQLSYIRENVDFVSKLNQEDAYVIEATDEIAKVRVEARFVRVELPDYSKVTKRDYGKVRSNSEDRYMKVIFEHDPSNSAAFCVSANVGTAKTSLEEKS